MQTSTKMAAVAAALLAVIVTVLRHEGPQVEGVEPVTVGEPTLAPGGAEVPDGAELGEADAESTGARSVLAAEAEAEAHGELPDAATEVGPDEAVAVSTVRARLLGVDGGPLSGATFSSIYTDGRPRGTGNEAIADDQGVVVLELVDSAMRAWRGEVYDMMFAASAAGHATEFVVRRPVLHGDTDVGDVRMGLGGAMVGTCVDADGRPVAGALLYAGASVLTEPLETLRLTGPDTSVPHPRSKSGPDGRFVLGGIPADLSAGQAAKVRVWAHSEGYLWTLSDAVAVTPQGQWNVGRLVLEDVPKELRIEGIVLAPNGQPAPGARVDYTSSGNGQEGHREADAQGRFVLVPRGDASMELVARDPSGEWGMSSSVYRKAGETVELRLTEKRVISVVVTDKEGAPIPEASLMAMLEGGMSFFAGGGRPVPGMDWIRSDEDGHAEVPVPGDSFTVSASKTGFSGDRVGPFEPGAAPKSLVIALEKNPEIVGKVLAYGEPVEGARISIGQRHDGTVTMTGGFPNRFWLSSAPLGPTDADGHFAAPLDPDATKLAVLARHPDWAAGEATLDVIAGEGADGVVIHMTEGGAVEGTVIPPPGKEVAGLYVAASRADGEPISTVVGADGRYRFEGLTPGDWRIEGRKEVVRTDSMSVSQRPEEAELRWNVVIVDRKTVEFDVDMRNLGDVQVQGQLLVDGAPPAPGWTATVVLPIHETASGDAPAAELDGEGRFVFTSRPGRLDLRLVGPVPGGATVEMLREVNLSGADFVWEGTLQTGQVDEVLDGSPERARFVRGSYYSGDREITIVPVGAEGTLKAAVPIGSSSLQVPSGGTTFGNAWDAVRMVDVQ